MKIRTGFVSNSSSSSFICMISGRVEAGMDMSIRDAEMVECVNGHVFQDEFIVGKILPINIDSDEDDHYEEWRYECPEENCPICTMNHLPDSDILSYIYKIKNTERSDYIKTIKAMFDNYKSFREYISK